MRINIACAGSCLLPFRAHMAHIPLAQMSAIPDGNSAPAPAASGDLAILMNLPYVKGLAGLSSLLYQGYDSSLTHDIPVRVQFQKDISSDQPQPTTVTVTAITQEAFRSLPPRPFENHYYEYDYSDSDEPTKQMFVGFFHMIEERDQNRILGSRYPGEKLLPCMEDMYSEFMRGDIVTVYLDSLGIADEFSVDGPTGSLSPAITLLRELAGSQFSDVHMTTDVALVEGGVRVSVSSRSLDYSFRVRGGTVEASIKDEVVERLKAEGLRACREYNMSPPNLAPHGEVGEGRDIWIPHLGGEHLRAGNPGEYYGWMAWVAGEALASLYVDFLRQMGVPDDEMLRWVWQYCGHEEGEMFAAGGRGGASMQVGVRGLGCSMFREAGDATAGTLEDAIDARVSVRTLRRVGRMGYADNVVRGLPSVGGRQFVVQRDDGRWVCVNEGQPGAVVNAVKLDDGVMVG